MAVIPRKKTLDRVLSRAGLGSRTEARRWIADGRVCVNGKKVQTPDGWVDPERDKVTFDGKPLKAARKVYLLLYKPKGYLTTFKDPEGRPTVYDLLAPSPLPDGRGSHDQGQWVFPVGRLDQDTSGLLLLTNDSEFGDYVSSPASHVPKTYLVKASRLLTEEELEQLRNGLQLADGPTRPAVVERIRDSGKYTFFEITLTEGRNRQVRRMVEALQAKVLKLVRVRIGDIRIGDLQIGTVRPLTEPEVRSLTKDRLPTSLLKKGDRQLFSPESHERDQARRAAKKESVPIFQQTRRQAVRNGNATKSRKPH